jgi:dihydrofolate reductase
MAKRTAPAPVSRTDVVYSCAISLDGYIAAADGGVDWLNSAMVKGESYDLPEFQRSIDGILMGSRTYEQAIEMGGMMGGKIHTWVFSRRSLPSRKGVTITSASPAEIVKSLPGHGVRRAWLMGGGLLAASFLEQGLIDEVGLAIMPVVLGSGIPLFGSMKTYASLHLIESKTYKGGAIGLRYAPIRSKRA